MNLYVGTSGYSYKEWKGSFYPEDLPAKQMLRYYGQHFRTVEINQTFNAMPKPTVLKGWTDEVPTDFQFVIKAHKRITHMKRLKEVDEPVRYLLEVTEPLAKHQGPLLFQLPPNFKKDAERLRTLLALLPPPRRAAFEFRHESWFDDEIYGVLREHNAALCIADAEDDLEVPFVATANWGYLRLRRPDYPTAKLKAWMKQVQAQEWEDAFVFFKHEDEGKGPQFARQFLELS
jgi:uncharacterized protein YecE (DUF72 family)